MFEFHMGRILDILIVFEEGPFNLLFHGIIFPLNVSQRMLHLIQNIPNHQDFSLFFCFSIYLWQPGLSTVRYNLDL